MVSVSQIFENMLPVTLQPVWSTMHIADAQGAIRLLPEEPYGEGHKQSELQEQRCFKVRREII